MNIYIMSRGRAGKVNTLNWISRKWREQTYLVVGHHEANIYRSFYPLGQVIPAPEYVTNYSQKFQYILDGLKDSNELGGHIEQKAIILDDDLVFSSRNDPERPNSLISITNPDFLDEMWETISERLDQFPLVGVHPRQMGHFAPQPFVRNGRIICLQGINRGMIEHVKVDQFPILADVILNCTLLARGQENAIITTFFQDHGPCQAPGGCSIYRTHEMQREAVEYLAGRFPGYVSVVARQTKDRWLANEQGVRYDYRCQWKQLASAGRAHVLDPGKVPHPDKEARESTEAVE